MRSSGDDWCVHYAGFYDRDAPMQKRACCDAGVEYASVEKKVEFTYCRYGDKHVHKSNVAHPCFKRESHLTNGCPKQKFNTLSELAVIHAENDRSYARIGSARAAIVAELKRRFDDGDKAVKMNGKPHADVDCYADSPKNYHSGAGTMKCPNCKDGVLKYSRAGYNGHVHAACSTEGCAAWME